VLWAIAIATLVTSSIQLVAYRQATVGNEALDRVRARWAARAGLENTMDLMEDGGLNSRNVAEFVEVGMTVGEFSSPLLKGPDGKFVPGTGQITGAVQDLRAVLDAASAKYRSGGRLIPSSK